MRKILLFALIFVSISGAQFRFTTNERVLQVMIDTKVSTRDSLIKYVTPKQLETRLSQFTPVGSGLDTSAINWYRLGAYQIKGSYLSTADSALLNGKQLTLAQLSYKLNITDTSNFNAKSLALAQLATKQGLITNIADTTKYMEYADTTAKTPQMWRVNGKLNISDTSNFNAKSLTLAQLAMKQNIISNLSDTVKYVEKADTAGMFYKKFSALGDTAIAHLGRLNSIVSGGGGGSTDSTIFAKITKAASIAHDTMAAYQVDISGWTAGRAPMKSNDSTITNGASYGTATTSDSLATLREIRSAVSGLSSGSSTGSGEAKVDSFATTAVRDTVAWTGMHSYDIVSVSSMCSAPTDTLNIYPLSVYADEGRAIVNRKYGNRSGQKYSLIRYAGTAPTGGGGITLVDSTGGNAWATSQTLSVTNTASSNAFMLVFVMGYSSDTVTAVTYAGASMTWRGSFANGNHRVSVYGKTAPAVGTANVVATATADAVRCMAVLTFNGVNQATPAGGLFSSASNWSSTPSLTSTSATGEVLISFMVESDASQPAFTATSGQTKLARREGINAGDVSWVTSLQVGAASVTTAWTNSPAGNTSQVAISLKP